MSEDETKTTEPKPSTKKKVAKKKPAVKNNTMNIKLTDSAGTTFTATGACTDKEAKAVFRALNHSTDQTFKVTDNG